MGMGKFKLSKGSRFHGDRFSSLAFSRFGLHINLHDSGSESMKMKLAALPRWIAILSESVKRFLGHPSPKEARI
jgi:hypothetical protein